MNKFFCRFLLLVACALLSFSAWCVDKSPGGQGTLISDLTNNCFKAGSGSFVEVCATYRINWKMWSLMGEPVGDYNLAWTLNSIKLMPTRRVM